MLGVQKPVQLLPASLPTMMRQSLGVGLQSVRTHGDGACALHAVFGKLTQFRNGSAMMYLPDARDFLAQVLRYKDP